MSYSFKSLETVKDADTQLQVCIREKIAGGCEPDQAVAICYEEMRSQMNQPEIPDNQIYLLPITGVIGEQFKYTDLLMHINKAKDSTAVKLVIDSPGGFVDEGLKMRDALLNLGKPLYATNSGDIASIAVSIFLTATNRTFNPAKGTFLIHNPIGDIEGTADDFELAAKELKKIEAELVKFYAKITGTSETILLGFMDENKPLTPEQIQDLGFATIETQQLKAVAYVKHLNNNTMTELKLDDASQKKLNGIESMLKKIQEKISNVFKAKNLMVQDVNGVELDFGEEIKAPEEIVVGISATVDGTPAEGDFTLPDGTVYKFAAGVLSEIIPPMSEQMAALKTENDQLKADLAAAQAKNTEIENQVKEVNNQFIAFKNQFSKGDPNSTADLDDDPDKTPKARHAFKQKEN